jgi:hypothetical protein
MYAKFVTGSSGGRADSARRCVPNGDSELQQFAVDPRSAPETILSGQTPNQAAID